MAEKMKYCGLGILIVNHFKDNAELIRPDAENEKNRMIELYAALGLEVEKHEDLTLKQMEDVLVEVSKSENLKNYDILVIGIRFALNINKIVHRVRYLLIKYSHHTIFTNIFEVRLQPIPGLLA